MPQALLMSTQSTLEFKAGKTDTWQPANFILDMASVALKKFWNICAVFLAVIQVYYMSDPAQAQRADYFLLPLPNSSLLEDE